MAVHRYEGKSLSRLIDAYPRVREEVDHKVHVWEEERDYVDDWEPRTEAEALKEIAQDLDDLDRYPAAFHRDVMRILVAIGCYREISEEDAREQCRSGIGVKMRHFPKLDGKRYDFVGWTFG